MRFRPKQASQSHAVPLLVALAVRTLCRQDDNAISAEAQSGGSEPLDPPQARALSRATAGILSKSVLFTRPPGVGVGGRDDRPAAAAQCSLQVFLFLLSESHPRIRLDQHRRMRSRSRLQRGHARRGDVASVERGHLVGVSPFRVVGDGLHLDLLDGRAQGLCGCLALRSLRLPGAPQTRCGHTAAAAAGSRGSGVMVGSLERPGIGAARTSPALLLLLPRALPVIRPLLPAPLLLLPVALRTLLSLTGRLALGVRCAFGSFALSAKSTIHRLPLGLGSRPLSAVTASRIVRDHISVGVEPMLAGLFARALVQPRIIGPALTELPQLIAARDAVRLATLDPHGVVILTVPEIHDDLHV